MYRQPRAAATIEEIDSDGETDFPSNEAENDDKVRNNKEPSGYGTNISYLL
jgi:hypothetical protein